MKNINKVLDIIFLIMILLAIPLSSSSSPYYVTYYSSMFEGKKTASGDIFRQSRFTGASVKYPFGTRLKLTYRNKSVVVKINDRGQLKSNQIDISLSAFKLLAKTAQGKIKVKVEVLFNGSRIRKV